MHVLERDIVMMNIIKVFLYYQLVYKWEDKLYVLPLPKTTALSTDLVNMVMILTVETR